MAKNPRMGREVTFTSKEGGVDKINHPSHSRLYNEMFQNSNRSM